MDFLNRYCFLFLVLLISTFANAQKILLKGYLKDSITHYPIANGSIINENTRQTAKTNASGFFFIEVTVNDRLYIQSPTYYNDTVKVPVLFADTIMLYLSPSGLLLEGITVQSSYSKYQLDSIRRREDMVALRGSRIHTVGSPPPNGFGFNFSLDRLFKTKYKQQRKQELLYKRTEERLYVDYRFSPQVVASYTGLKGEALRVFMYQYTPSYAWLRQHPSQQDLLLYINDKLKLYKAGLLQINKR